MYLSLSLQPAKVLRTKMQMDFQCFSQLCIDSLPRIFSTGQMKRKLDHMRISNGHQAFKKPKIQRNNKHFSIFQYWTPHAYLNMYRTRSITRRVLYFPSRHFRGSNNRIFRKGSFIREGLVFCWDLFGVPFYERFWLKLK